MAVRLLIENIGMLATPTGQSACRGAEQGEITVSKNAYVAVGEDGNIVEVGTGTVPAGLRDAEQVVDAEGGLVTPGLVDAHTHLAVSYTHLCRQPQGRWERDRGSLPAAALFEFPISAIAAKKRRNRRLGALCWIPSCSNRKFPA